MKLFLETQTSGVFFVHAYHIKHLDTSSSHFVKVDLNKKLDSKQKRIQTFNIDAQGVRKTRNKNPPTW